MVFVSSELGEHSITTRDIDVNENTIVQFEVGRLDLLGALLLHITHYQLSGPGDSLHTENGELWGSSPNTSFKANVTLNF